MVKELRLHEISDRESANAFLPQFTEDYNQRFSVEPRNPEDNHQCEFLNDEELNLILSCQEYRKLSKSLELSYRNVIYQVQSQQKGYRLRKARLLVSESTQGIVNLWHQGKLLPYTTITKQQRRTEILNNKEKDRRVDEVIKGRKVSCYKPDVNHPWKRQKALAMMVRKSKILQPVLADQ